MSLAFHMMMIAVYEKYDDMSIGNPLLFARVGSLTMHVIESEPLRQSGTLITSWAQLY
jgi:hypothetical protein